MRKPGIGQVAGVLQLARNKKRNSAINRKKTQKYKRETAAKEKIVQQGQMVFPKSG